MTTEPTTSIGATAMVGVNVVPMDSETVLRDHTVLVRDGRIANVSPRGEVDLPAGVTVIEEQGAFVMPGLADMHTHLGLRDQEPDHLILYLATGTTTVRSMSGGPTNPEWRRLVETGELVSPTILTSGEVLTGPLEDEDPDAAASLPIFIPRTPADAAAEVRRQAAGWADFIKVYDGLTEEQYLAAIAAANQAPIYVAGHAIDEASLQTILNSGINEIAHLDELNMYHWIGFPGEPDFAMDHAAIPDTAALMAERDIAIVSNLVADEIMYELIFDTEEVLSRPEYEVVRPELLADWRTTGRQKGKFAGQGEHRRDIEMPFFKALISGLSEAGVTITIGTDTSTLEGSVPSNIHRELELLVESGMSAYQALGAGTRDAGLITGKMGRDGGFGTVTPGQRADLLLLRDNPLEDVSRTRNRIGVMARGVWHSQRDLDSRVAEFVTTY